MVLLCFANADPQRFLSSGSASNFEVQVWHLGIQVGGVAYSNHPVAVSVTFRAANDLFMEYLHSLPILPSQV